MVPKAPPLSPEPSKEEKEIEEPFFDEEEEESDEEEEESEAQSAKDEQENSSDETEEGSSEDEDEDQKSVKSNNLSTPPPNSNSKPISQENGWESDSDSDSDSDGSPSDYKLQQIRQPSVSSSKRTSQEVDGSEDSLGSSKKSKIGENKSSSTPSSGCITRLWSNEDEISVLNGMVEFRNEKGLDPNADLGAFYNFIKGKLQVDFSKDQMRTKINRMKKRFSNALTKGENGSDPVFSKPHEVMVFDLSKKIWGVAFSKNDEKAKNDFVKAERVVVNEKATMKQEEVGEEGDFWSEYPFLSASFRDVAGNFPSLLLSESGVSSLKEKLSLIGNVKAKELDEKWKQFFVEDTELKHKMLALMTEQVKMALGK